MKAVAVLLTSLGLACGARPSPAPPAPPPPAPAPLPRTANIAPFGLDRAPSALILGTGSGGASTVVVLAEPPHEVALQVADLRLAPGTPASGAVSKLTLRAALGPQDDPTAGGARADSAAWRAGQWAAALEVGALLARAPGDVTLLISSDDPIDGPAASALLAAGALASLTGAEPRGDTTLVGVLNPDGTIGPAGGIRERASAAANASLTRLGYPAGQAVTVAGTAVADVRDAYALLTGQRLPTTELLPPEAMALASEHDARLVERYASWRSTIGLHWDTVFAIKSKRQLPTLIDDLAERAQWTGTAAEKLLRDDRPAAAYDRALQAAVYSQTVTSLVALLDGVHEGDVDGARYLLDAELGASDRARAALEQIAAHPTDTIGDTLAVLSAYQRATAALALRTWAVEHAEPARAAITEVAALPREQRKSTATAERLAAAVAAPLIAAARADAYARAAIETLELDAVDSLAFRLDDEAARRLTGAYAAAATAALEHFETFAPAAVLGDHGGLVDPTYVTARGALAAAHEGDGLRALACAQRAQLDAALAISTWSSLGVERDLLTGRVDGVRYSLALATLLHNAERKAREHARAAEIAIGIVPIQTRRHYAAAMALREGGLADRVAALEQFWRASMWARTAVALARGNSR